MILEVLVLGLFSGLRPGTSLAAVLALLKSHDARRALLVFTVAGVASSWTIGLLVVAVLNGADVAVGGSTFTAVLDALFGAAALAYGLRLRHRGPVRARRPRRPRPAAVTRVTTRFAPHLRNPSTPVAAAAGVATHLPGLVYLVALNAVVATQRGLAVSGLQIGAYVGLWFIVPLTALVLVALRPDAAFSLLDRASAWVRLHQHVLLVRAFLALGIYLTVKGGVALAT